MTARPFLLAASVLALAGCQPSDGAGPATGAPAANLIASAESLVGEYRVAGIDGTDLNLPHGVTASIAADRIEVTSDCIRFAWTYRFEEGVLATERAPITSCRRAVLPQETAIAEAFDAAGMVRRTPANGIEFTGEGRSVTLFSQ